MELKPGDKFGDRYALLSKAGEGGMGEVWKARDIRLDRDVALKVSKAEFTARFDREARAIAAFNHPNICQIYDVGPNYIVMEWIDGLPLQGPLTVEKAVASAGFILDALDAAHRKGFTHRDLKPANVMVTKSGILKLLDFGLAKQGAVGLGPDDVTGAALTAKGQISGTLQYMSPEQLQGQEADARSDIFSFGCVLYEMLSGSRAFNGSSAASVIAVILEREPEPLKTTPPLDRIVRACLAKDPDQRIQTARDVKTALQWAMEGESAPSASPRSRFSSTAWVAAAAMTVLAGIALWGWLKLAPAAPRPLIHFTTVAPQGMATNPIAVSPDGSHIAFVGSTANQIYLRSMDDPVAKPVAGTENGRFPAFSPDGQWLAFFAGSAAPFQLKKVPFGEAGKWGTTGCTGSCGRTTCFACAG